MAIPRRLITIAVSAAAAGVLLYVNNKVQQKAREQRKSPIDEANEAKDKAREKAAARDGDTDPDTGASSAAAATAEGAEDAGDAAGAGLPEGAQKELALFLAGEAWHDEIGWQALWEKEGITPDAWLKGDGKSVLTAEREKLTAHPALLAGCRRRWIVVCRYAGIDVAEAANLWNA